MKAKTRILAMLLAVLMIGGILPLSLFAAGSDSKSLPSNVVQAKPADRTLASIQEEFTKAGLTLACYQTFQKWQFASGTTEYAYPKSTDAQGAATYADFKTGTDNMISHKNGKEAFFIKTESDGNVALYLGSHAKESSGNDNYIDFSFNLPQSFENQKGNGSHDFYASADFKMNGSNITQSMTTGLFGLLYRINDGGASIIPTVSVTDVGGLYIGSEPNPDKLIGFLSDTEYTRVAISTNRATNKLYVYVNDILVNPEGSELIPESVVEAMNTGNKKNSVIYTPHNLPICNVRMFNYEDNVDVNAHKGIFIDNFLAGTRIATMESDRAAQDIFTSNFPAALDGANVTIPLSGSTGNAKAGVIWPGAITYFKEADGTMAMQWHQQPAVDTPCTTCKKDKCTCDQAYFDVYNTAAKGSNLRFSIDIKLGADGALGKDDFIFFRSFGGEGGPTASGNNETDFQVSLDNGGMMYAIEGKVDKGNAAEKGDTEDVLLGKITKTNYHNLTIDIVCNTIGESVVALFFFDGKLVYTRAVTFKYKSEYSTTDYMPGIIRVYPVYDGGIASLKPNDLCLKAVSLTVTDDYNSGGAISVFKKNISGFVNNAGLTRYYGTDGSFKTEDFEVYGEKYLVGFGGIVLGKETDGVEFAPYAAYEDWTHADYEDPDNAANNRSLHHKSPNGDAVGGDLVKWGRDAFVVNATIPVVNDPMKLYGAYYDKKVNSDDHNSYIQIDLPSDKRTDAQLVLDFDLMMSETPNSTDKSLDNHTFFHFVNNSMADGSGPTGSAQRPDSPLIKMSVDGWFSHNGQKLIKLSKTEFTRISLVINLPSDDQANGTIDLYANGVKIIGGIALNANAKRVNSVRLFSSYNQDIAYYIKDLYLYDGNKPQKFITMENGEAVATTDYSKTPANASDIKKGFVSENGVVRYYDENGLPRIADNSIDVDGKIYTADANGVLFITEGRSEAIGNIGHLSVDYKVDFGGILNGDYGFAANTDSASTRLFGLTFTENYNYISITYKLIRLEIYLPSKPAAGINYTATLGETQRFYEIKWKGGDLFTYAHGSYFVDENEVPEGAIEFKEPGTYSLENMLSGTKNIVAYDTDDVPGVSHGDKFYVRTHYTTEACNGSFSDLSAGWNTVDIPVLYNGGFGGIDHLAITVSSPLDASFIENIKIASVKLIKSERFVIKEGVEDGVYSDGCYYKDGIAQIGWIDENNSSSADEGDYYVNPDNAKIVTGIFSVDGVWYKFDTDGKLVGKANGVEYVKNGFDANGNALFAYKKFNDGAIDTSGLIQIEENKYIFTDANGVSAQNRIIDVAGAFYSFGADGYGTLLCANTDAHKDDDGVVTKPSTCTTQGTKVFTCTVCGREREERLELDPNFHEVHDAKGMATCHAGVKADGVTSLYGHSISLGENVTVKFYFDVTGTEGAFEIGRRSAFIAETTTKVNITELEDVTVGDKTYKVVSVTVPAHAVDSVVIVRYVRPDGFAGSSYEYNVQEYITGVSAHAVDETFTQKIIDLVKAYDVFAKNVKKVVYSEGAPAKITDINEMNFNTNHAVSFSYNDKNVETGSIRIENTYENLSFDFGESLKIKLNFTLVGVSSDFKFYVNGEETTATYLTMSGRYCVEAEFDISNLDEEIIIKVTHENGSECLFNTSALACAKRMFMSNTSTDDEQNLMKAVYKLSVAVDALTPEEAE